MRWISESNKIKEIKKTIVELLASIIFLIIFYMFFVFLIVLAGCGSSHILPDKTYDVRQIRTDGISMGYVICRNCVDYTKIAKISDLNNINNANNMNGISNVHNINNQEEIV